VLPVVGAAAELKAVRAQLAEAVLENQALRSELSAFDPAFWDEIEDLKYRCALYAPAGL